MEEAGKNLPGFATDWQLTHFQPISFCNTFSLHLLDQGRCPLVIDINGSLHWAEWRSEVDDGISLKQCLDEPERDVADFDLELVASDSMLLPGNGRQTNAEYIFDGCIGTCWVLYDHLFAVARQFAVLFLILPNFHLKMAAKFPLQSAPTFSKIHFTDDHRFVWLVFTYSHDVTVFSVGFDGSVSQLPINDPMLAMPGNSGSVIRYEQISNWGAHRLLLLGYDTGFLVASICSLSPPNAYDKTPSLIDRKCLKFDGPLSVLKVLKIDQMNVFVLVSSTLGPATVWSLRKDEEGMLGWHLVTMLKESELCDTVVTGTVYRSAANDGTAGMVLIGTYGELLLAYDLLELLAQQTHQGGNEVGPKLSINIASPVLAVEQFRDELLVLSNRGLHRLSPSVDGIFSLTQQRKSLTTVVNIKDEKRTAKSNKADAQ